MGRRIGDNPSSKMMMINTIFFGVAAGMVGLLWISFADGNLISEGSNEVLIDRHEILFIATVAILFAGLFHSVLILHPKHRQNTADLERTKSEFAGLRDLAMRDPLTSIHNRRFFDNSLDAYIDIFAEKKQSFGVLLIDLDHFKEVNDTYGHDAGDYVLKKLSKTLLKSSRSYDVVARIGGEEFAVIAPIAKDQDLSSIAERYREAIRTSQVRYDDKDIMLSASVGAVVFVEGLDAKALMLLADDKLYQAKNNGRDQVAT